MSKYEAALNISQAELSDGDFMKSYNEIAPANFPRVSLSLLKKFREAHASLFKNSELWSLDVHRKKLIDWLPRNVEVQ